MDRNKIYYIEWHDAHCDGRWFTDRDVQEFIDKERCICQEVGWILSETKTEIVLACRKLKWKKDGDAEWGMLQKIPKAWIRRKVLINLKHRTGQPK